MPSGEKMEVTKDLLDQLITLHIGDARTFVLLSLLHQQHAFHQKSFQKDHIHPHKGFDNLEAFGFNEDQFQKWHDWKNRLPNLQLLQDGENNNKRAKPFKDWLPVYRLTDEARRSYLAENDIPEGISLELKHFKEFFEGREKLLRQRLVKFLEVREDNEPTKIQP